MSAFEERQRGGAFGPAGLTMLEKLMGQEARRLPVLGNMSEDRVDDLVQTFFVERGMMLTAQVVAAGVADDEALGRYLRRSVRNWLARGRASLHQVISAADH